MRFIESEPPGEPGSDRATWLRPAARQDVEVVVWGAHGGAGVTTLAMLLKPAFDMDSMGPSLHPRFPAAVAGRRHLIIACRPTPLSARAATTAVAVVTRACGQVTALAVVSDGWPEPDAATARFRLLAPQVGAVVRIPFVPGLRLTDDPRTVPLPRRAVRALDHIRTAAGRSPHL